MNGIYSRRKFIRGALFSGPVLLGTGLIAGLAAGACGRGKKTENAEGDSTPVNSCEDFSGVSQEELEKRKNLGYVEESPIPDNQCQNCNLWLPPAEGKECGGCTLFKGPVYASAYCTYWAPQV
ncbi:MAG TPA: high-potential iron-sulfur protein [Anseongella sp.]|nr:high-potential iron-sulfur protein [Anseongella sp.]